MTAHLATNHSRLRAAVVASLVVSFACDAEDDPEIEAEAQTVIDEIPEDLVDAVLDVPEPGEGVVGDEARTNDITWDGKPQGFTFQGWFSEESTGSSQCPVNQVVTGFNCSGDFCDNVNIECHSYGTSVGTAGTFSLWFEHEYSPGWGTPGSVKKMHICPSDQKMTGIDWWGSYCDNISIECTPAPGLATNRCAWSNWYSDEAPSPFFAPNGSAIQGVWCSGNHCDDKRFLVCET